MSWPASGAGRGPGACGGHGRASNGVASSISASTAPASSRVTDQSSGCRSTPRASSEAVLAERPTHSRREALLRRAWRGLGPVCAIARLSGDPASEVADELPDPGPWVLLTGGPESDAKVVALPFAVSGEPPEVVVKFARTDRAEAALAREAEILRQLEQERPQLGGVPRLHSQVHRSGRLGVAQDAFRGKALNTGLDAASFAVHAPRITRWLIDLAGEAKPQPTSAWSERLVAAPLDELEADFADRLPADLVGPGAACARRARRPAADLRAPRLRPLERRPRRQRRSSGDRLGGRRATRAAGARPDQLPAERDPRGRGRVGVTVAGASCTDGAGRGRRPAPEYCAAMGIAKDDFQRLRLLCWVVQSLIALRRLAKAETATAPGRG